MSAFCKFVNQAQAVLRSCIRNHSGTPLQQVAGTLAASYYHYNNKSKALQKYKN